MTPNSISAASLVFSALGAAAFIAAPDPRIHWSLCLILAALFIQLRLICNLMDGMVAIEKGRKSATGAIWNELPDRFADAMLLVAAGWAAGIPWVGGAAAWCSAITAYIRSSGAELTGAHDFCGPGAKPQRMAILTLGSLVAATGPLWQGGTIVLQVTIWTILILTALTIFRRSLRLAATLKRNAP